MSTVRLGAATGCAMLLALLASPAQAADPHPAKPRAGGKHDGRAHAPDGGLRRSVAGAPTVDETSAGAETPELRALREAELELFPPAAPVQGSPWPTDLPFTMPGEPSPRVTFL